ncbi:MAG: DUF4340 domain-containing protein [Candidatus Eisenbacteria bacterium]|nr:DUF4340 domain-containing protein [Candidatus Latescibacterota bacterium]MBD3302259.1 DUF4340 domain-containing protein [Candidatus Eisenbacteria bacterium]
MARRGPSAAQAILIVALLGVLFVWYRIARNGGPAEPGSEGIVPPLPEEEIEEILFERGEERIRVVRETDGFWIVEPYRDRADERFLRSSLRVAATLEPERILPDTAGAQFGLDPPAAAWTAAWSGGRFRVVLGDTVPAGGGRYGRPGGARRIWILDPFLVRRFLAPPTHEIHSPVPAPIGHGRVDTLRIATREEEITLTRRPGGEWTILHPFRFDAEARTVQRAVNDLRRETITAYLGPLDSVDLPAHGLDPPRATWQLIQGGRRPEVVIGHPTPDERSVHVIPAGREVVALIPSESFRIFVDGLERLRDPRLFLLPADSVRTVEVRAGADRRRFARAEAGGWVEIAADGEERPLRSDALETAVRNLVALRAVSYPEARSGSAFPEAMRIRLLLRDGSRDSLQLARPQGDALLARAPRQPGWVRLPAAVHRTWRLWLDRPLRP